MTVDNAIREVVSKDPKKQFSKKEIIERINAKYPKKWVQSGIATQIYACCVNIPKAYKQFPSSPKILFCKNRLYQWYDPEIHGQISTAGGSPAITNLSDEDEASLSASVSLERDLEEYIVRYLGRIEKGLTLYAADGIKGRQFNTDAGIIDILAVDGLGDFVVIELKAGTATSHAFGQIMAYVGWVQQHIAHGKKVSGILIADEFDGKLKYAIAAQPNIVRLTKYEVSFTFTDV